MENGLSQNNNIKAKKCNSIEQKGYAKLLQISNNQYVTYPSIIVYVLYIATMLWSYVVKLQRLRAIRV